MTLESPRGLLFSVASEAQGFQLKQRRSPGGLHHMSIIYIYIYIIISYIIYNIYQMIIILGHIDVPDSHSLVDEKDGCPIEHAKDQRIKLSQTTCQTDLSREFPRGHKAWV